MNNIERISPPFSGTGEYGSHCAEWLAYYRAWKTAQDNRDRILRAINHPAEGPLTRQYKESHGEQARDRATRELYRAYMEMKTHELRCPHCRKD